MHVKQAQTLKRRTKAPNIKQNGLIKHGIMHTA